MLDLKKMKERLGNIKTNPKGFWEIPKGESVVRIVPIIPDEVAKSFFLHYNVGKSNAFLCPKRTFGDFCPVCDFASELWKEDTKESKKMAKGLFVKKRFYSPIVVRNKESEEKKVLWWSYAEKVYNDILGICSDSDYGDVTDLEKGYDLKLSRSPGDGKLIFPETKVKPQKNSSRLFPDFSKEECEEFLKNVPDILDLLDKKTSQEVQELVNKCYLSEEEDAEEVSSEIKKYNKKDKETKEETKEETKSEEVEGDDIDKMFAELKS